jgi:hypothetical protein
MASSAGRRWSLGFLRAGFRRFRTPVQPREITSVRPTPQAVQGVRIALPTSVSATSRGERHFARIRRQIPCEEALWLSPVSRISPADEAGLALGRAIV